MKVILGTVPHTGEICLAPELFRGKERLIGYMPQLSDFDREFPISVLEVVLSGLQGCRGFRSPYTREDREKAMALLASSGIAETARQPIGEVSGGQMQRALLARAVISDPKLLILDEPVTGLDPAAAQDLYRTLAYLNKNEGLAIVMVTHDLQSALQYADTVLYAGQGKWFHGTTAEYLASPYGRRFGGERT